MFWKALPPAEGIQYFISLSYQLVRLLLATHPVMQSDDSKLAGMMTMIMVVVGLWWERQEVSSRSSQRHSDRRIMGRPDSYHHSAGALGGCDPDEGEANKWIGWISGRMAWTVVGCEGWKPSRNRTAGSTVAGTPAPSSRLVGSRPANWRWGRLVWRWFVLVAVMNSRKDQKKGYKRV